MQTNFEQKTEILNKKGSKRARIGWVSHPARISSCLSWKSWLLGVLVLFGHWRLRPRKGAVWTYVPRDGSKNPVTASVSVRNTAAVLILLRTVLLSYPGPCPLALTVRPLCWGILDAGLLAEVYSWLHFNGLGLECFLYLGEKYHKISPNLTFRERCS